MVQFTLPTNSTFRTGKVRRMPEARRRAPSAPASLRAALAALSLALLASCGPDGLADQVAREAAKDAVRPVLRQRFPGIPLEPSVNCVIDNASASEILTLAEAGVAGRPDAGTVDLVLDIVRRPDTIECLATEGLAAFLR